MERVKGVKRCETADGGETAVIVLAGDGKSESAVAMPMGAFEKGLHALVHFFRQVQAAHRATIHGGPVENVVPYHASAQPRLARTEGHVVIQVPTTEGFPVTWAMTPEQARTMSLLLAQEADRPPQKPALQ